MRLAIIGNSGSGKSTLARWAAELRSAPCLDLDTVAWEPDGTAVPRDPRLSRAEVRAFCEASAHWVVEGCYADLVRVTLPFRPRLVFLDPGPEQCLANCRARSWEPHKYASRAEQDERLEFLLTWVGEYYTREGELSLAGHRALFEEYDGVKKRLGALPRLDVPSPELLAWID